MTIKELSEEIARTDMLVEAHAMTNIAGCSPDDRIARVAEYERAKAKVVVLREELVTLTRWERAKQHPPEQELSPQSQQNIENFRRMCGG